MDGRVDDSGGSAICRPSWGETLNDFWKKARAYVFAHPRWEFEVCSAQFVVEWDAVSHPGKD
jgi:hypothetical protein